MNRIGGGEKGGFYAGVTDVTNSRQTHQFDQRIIQRHLVQR